MSVEQRMARWRCWLVTAFWIGLVVSLGANPAGAATALTKATDLAEEGDWVRQQRSVLVLMFSRQDCRYCEIVRRDYLLPLQQDARYRDRVRIRQIDQDSSAFLKDFAGQPTQHDAFARMKRVRMVPVVMFVNDQGQSLSSPLIGLPLPDFYQSYLEDGLNNALNALKAQRETSPPAGSGR